MAFEPCLHKAHKHSQSTLSPCCSLCPLLSLSPLPSCHQTLPHQNRCTELQEAVARQLLSSDTSLQACALKCLATFKLTFLPHNLQAFLLQLSDSSNLRGGLIHIPSMFDESLTAEQQRAQQEQQQRQATKAQAGGRKGGGGGGGQKAGEVGRVDASIRPGVFALSTKRMCWRCVVVLYCFWGLLLPVPSLTRENRYVCVSQSMHILS